MKTFIRKRRRPVIDIVTVHIVPPSQKSRNIKNVVPEYIGEA